MGKQTKTERSVIVLLVLAVVAMTIGFAAYTQQLNINGNVTVKGSPWNVHYIENQVTTTTGSVTATAESVSKTDFEFTVTLEKPGDFYEATVVAKNEGSINAILKSIEMSTLSTDQQKYLKYSVTYDGTEYTASTTGLSKALNAGVTHNVVVRVEYLDSAAQADLPEDDVNVTVTGHLNYESAT